jgi:TRAP-type mannitol/chloroaromatic compound transport system substrate-binding protein
MYAAGEIVGGFEAIPATAKGKLDMVHSSGYYLTGTLRWISLIVGTQANYITYPDEHIAWMFDGGGLELYQEYLNTKYDLKVIPTGIHASEPLWTTKPVTTKEDFKGLKVRSTGLNMAFYQNLGCAVITMPMGEVVPALERKVLDGAEFCVPYTDYPGGLHKVCPYALVGRIHLPCMLGFGAFINGESWRALPDDLKKFVELAAKLIIFRTMHYWNGYKAMVLTEKMINEGVTINQVSPELQSWFNEVGDQMAQEYANKNPWAKKILDSQKSFIDKYRKYQGAIAPYFRD